VITDAAARRILFCVEWSGPWERLQGLCYGVRADNTLRWEISRHPRGRYRLLSAAGDFCGRRDAAWRNRHLRRGTVPPARWKRRA
jgi:hypothetical protein